MTIIEQIARALACKHYSDRFRPVEGRESIIEQNVDCNWPIFTADAAVAMEAAGEAFAKLLDAESGALFAGQRIRYAIEDELKGKSDG